VEQEIWTLNTEGPHAALADADLFLYQKTVSIFSIPVLLPESRKNEEHNHVK